MNSSTKEGEPVKPKPKSSKQKRKYPPTLKIRTDDPESAARSIINSYPEDEFAKLLAELYTETFHADIPADLRDEITAEARRVGISNGEMLRRLWLYYDVGYSNMVQRLAAAATEE